MPRDPEYFQQSRPEMRAFLPASHPRVLEIGCGEANFSAVLPGIEELWGVEPDRIAADSASTRMQRVLVGNYQDIEAQLPDSHFDLVIACDVIEHMPDHDAFLRRIKAKIAPGGCLVGSVPNVRYYKNLFDTLVLKDWHYKDAGILDRTHMRYFTQKSLARSLGESGYRIDRIRPINATVGFASPRTAVYSLFAVALVAASLGHQRDVPFMQIGFRATPA
jgi:2-polyprenyl-3-methyl-5-hydroxy-6-metoxy-1,4-benzoquinol methylase